MLENLTVVRKLYNGVWKLKLEKLGNFTPELTKIMIKQDENSSLKFIYSAVGIASTTDAILVFLFPILLLNYYNIELTKVTIIFTIMRISSPIFTYIAGYLADTRDMKKLIIYVYILAVIPNLALIAAYFVQNNLARFLFSSLSAITSSLVFSMVLIQEPYIVENSTIPQKSLMRLYFIGFTCLFFGSLWMTVYFTFTERIVPLLIIKLVTDFVAMGLVSFGLLKKDNPIIADKIAKGKTTKSEETISYNSLTYNSLILSLVTFSICLAFLGYFATYYIPIFLNEKFMQMKIVSASFIFINGANGLINLVLFKKFQNILSVSITYLLTLSSAILLFSFHWVSDNLFFFFIWLSIFSIIYAILFTYGKVNMLLIAPDHIKGRMRAMLQSLIYIFSGIIAYVFLTYLNNDPFKVGLVSAIILIISGTLCTFIIKRSFKEYHDHSCENAR